jgi:hypothetical protein
MKEREPITWRETPGALVHWALWGAVSWGVLFLLVLAGRALWGLL